MADKIRPLIAGNWKMHGLDGDLAEIDAVARLSHEVDVMICPPATLLSRMSARCGALLLGGQDCHEKANGAFTGDISAQMLKDAGAGSVILGHSERRIGHNESDALIVQKTVQAHKAGLHVIICVGENLSERENGAAVARVQAQLSASMTQNCTAQNCTIAYEPIWAIGSGLTPALDEIAEIHAAIRASLKARIETGDAMRILYGGSVKPDNAGAILSVDNVNGALVGGASHKARDFLGIIAAAH